MKQFNARHAYIAFFREVLFSYRSVIWLNGGSKFDWGDFDEERIARVTKTNCVSDIKSVDAFNSDNPLYSAATNKPNPESLKAVLDSSIYAQE